MNIDDIIQQLTDERSRLDAAIAALEGTRRRGLASWISQASYSVGGGSKAYLGGDEEALGRTTEEGKEVGLVRDAMVRRSRHFQLAWSLPGIGDGEPNRDYM